MTDTTIVGYKPPTTFEELTDVETDYTGKGGYHVVVKSDATGLDFATTDTVDINAGTIDGVTIAGTTPVKFGLTPTVVGTPDNGSFYWKATDETPTIQLHANVALSLGEKELRLVYNPSASDTISRGAAVYTNGIGGSPTIVSVALAQADSVSTYDVLGLAAEDILPQTQGFIIVRGHIGELDTSGYDGAAGDSLYLSATVPGGVTSTVPEAPNFEVRVGRLIVKNASGKINVRITKAYSLDNLTDVQVPAPVANQLLKYDGVSWIASDSSVVSSAGGTDFFLTDADAAIEGMTRAAACVVTWTGHGLATGSLVKFEGITQTGWTALNSPSGNSNVFHTITYINVNSFSIPVNTSGYAGDYVPATDPGTISSGKIFSAPDTTISTQTDSAESTNSVEALIDSYCTPLPLGRTSITGGEWSFRTWCYASSLTDTNTVVIRVYKRSAAGAETLLFYVETADLNTVNTLSQISSIQPSYAILTTDHLVFKYFAKSTRGGGNYRTCYITHNGTTNYSYVKTPISLGHASLGQLAYADAGHTGFSPANPLATDTLWAAIGDLAVGTGSDTASILSKGINGQYLKTGTSTLEWATISATGSVATDTIWDAAGDLVVGSGSDTAAKLSKGTALQVLRVKSDASTLEWATISSVPWSGVTDKPLTFSPSSHTHGSVTNDGKIGSTANIPIITTTDGALSAGSFGSTANTFCQGDDSRLSNARTPSTHNLIDTTGHAASGLTTGHFLKATGATTYGFGAHGLTASDVGAATTSTKLDDFATPDNNTDLNANTTNHGLLLKATAPAANVLNVVGIANGETVYANKALFDATNPAMAGVAAPGTALVAAHRDHVHPVDTSRAPSNPLATDTIWDAAGDLAVGTGADTAAKLSKGTALQVLRVKSDASTLEWATVPTGGGITWTEVTGTTGDAAVDNGYIASNVALVTITLPSTCAVGKIIRIAGKGAGGWKLAQNASQVIYFGDQNTTTGTGGYLASAYQYDAVELVCITANTTFLVISSVGDITMV